MRLKLTLLTSLSVIISAASMDLDKVSKEGLAAVALVGFCANLSPITKEARTTNNLWGLGVTTAIGFLELEKGLKQDDLLRRAFLYGLVYMLTVGLSRACHNIAISEIKAKYKCPCGKDFNPHNKVEFVRHLAESHNFILNLAQEVESDRLDDGATINQ